ncbi:delta-1-pyrroline-5-carboxylate dehydrogenase, mitochondrial [Exaiptasia diaphana]|uniref:Multifunctional fusion protein n=1 Tax=Exaiptasia diaphana TaxID=2652724 RepID=A0A913YAU2_EXADI|nr:delta-1-pyrroline-5-carboxylate dehydrogenase, mitochondrial [Exaiptasia diaphana]KXJ21289.1 Delta-1-pyrroline-5-carboxylate dehydrogenase, mitochondrial [Exaiptasia diaphana]
MLSIRSKAAQQLFRVAGARTLTMPPNEPATNIDGENRTKLLEAIKKLESETLEVPVISGGERIFTGDCGYQSIPYDHAKKITKYHKADEALIRQTIEKSMAARKAWERTSFEERCTIFDKVLDLMCGKYRYDLLASTMVGQGKTAYEADIDVIMELVDFYRFDVYNGRKLMEGPELHQPPGIKNTLYYRGMEGFVAAVAPFNFSAIAGNLAGTPAIMGNVVLFKPASTAIHSSYMVMKIFEEAGLPAGVLNFVPSSGPVFGNGITSSPDLAAVNFTGSVGTFKNIWQNVANNLDVYKTYPRLIGECGGKNYHFIHSSADVNRVVHCTMRAAFGYQGQKCSACSRMYVPESLWPQIKEGLIEEHKKIKMGSPADIENTFVTAVIDEKSFDNIKSYIDFCNNSSEITVLAGGKCDKSVGYYVEPTIVQTTNPLNKMMKEEIFGPVVSIYVYPDAKCKETIELCDQTNEFGLTGAIFAEDKDFIAEASDMLRDSAGNFYINDKCTGSIVQQQPFGGARMSGTNDKAGGLMYLLRWTSALVVKETSGDPGPWQYPHMN